MMMFWVRTVESDVTRDSIRRQVPIQAYTKQNRKDSGKGNLEEASH